MTMMNRDLDFLENGEVCMLFGRPGVGKTVMALNIALAAAEQGIFCYYYSMEQTCEELTQEFTRLYGEIDGGEIVGKGMRDDVLKKFGTTVQKLAKMPIYLVGNPDFDLKFMMNNLKENKIGPGSLVVIDYLQLATSIRDTEFVSTLKDFAISTDAKVLVLSQLRRSKNYDEEVSLETCAASSNREGVKVSDRICYVHRDSFLKQDAEDRQCLEMKFLKPINYCKHFTFLPSSGKVR